MQDLFRVQGLGFGVQGLGFRVQGLGFGVQGILTRTLILDSFQFFNQVSLPPHGSGATATVSPISPHLE